MSFFEPELSFKDNVIWARYPILFNRPSLILSNLRAFIQAFNNLSLKLIDTYRLYFPAIDTCGCANAQMSTTSRGEYILYVCSCVSLATDSSGLTQTTRPYLTEARIRSYLRLYKPDNFNLWVQTDFLAR